MPTSSQPRIIILTGASCPWCNRVKQYLREKRFSFREVNVEKDPEGARELKRRNIMGVPVVLINNRPIVGFDKAKIDKLLGIK
jgi:glutaredoxin 3